MEDKKVTKSEKKVSLQSPVVDVVGKETGKMDLPLEIFNIVASEKLLSLYVRVYLNNQRAGLASTKTRSMVSGSTRKIYKQKGTGRARHGANTAPIFVGGGVAHGPIPYIRKLKINKKQRTKALYKSLTNAYMAGDIKSILDSKEIDGTTKQLSKIVSTLGGGKKMMIVYSGSKEPMMRQAANNLDGVKLTQSETLNAYTVLSSNNMVFTKTGIEQFISQHMGRTNK